MQAQEILNATRKLEESGMTQFQAEAIASTIIEAIEPLATKEDLLTAKEELRNSQEALGSELRAYIKEVRTDLESSIKEVRTDLESSIKGVEARLDSLEENMATKADILSIKVWLLTGLLGLGGSALLAMSGLLFYALRFVG